jgi:hypothetical protein
MGLDLVYFVLVFLKYIIDFLIFKIKGKYGRLSSVGHLNHDPTIPQVLKQYKI